MCKKQLKKLERIGANLIVPIPRQSIHLSCPHHGASSKLDIDFWKRLSKKRGEIKFMRKKRIFS